MNRSLDAYWDEYHDCQQQILGDLLGDDYLSGDESDELDRWDDEDGEVIFP